MQLRRRDGIDLERFEGNGAKDLVEIGGKQRIEDVAQAVIVECGLRQPRLEQGHHPTFFQALPYFVQRMMPIQNGQHQGFDPMAS